MLLLMLLLPPPSIAPLEKGMLSSAHRNNGRVRQRLSSFAARRQSHDGRRYVVVSS
jgi:hypothetical protein